MISRREILAGAAATLLTRATAAHAQSPKNAEIGEALSTLPGKSGPLIRHTYRPPNFETPWDALRRPFTANGAFFVRYHLAAIPEVDARSWRLRVGGDAAGSMKEWSLDDLKQRFERVSIAAVAQCAGNRRGLFAPRVPGVQWGSGAMGNAIWSGVRLRDVLDRSGVNANALEVVFEGADGPLLPKTPDFAKSIPIERALEDSTLIAFEMNGEPLPHWNGAPARLIVPGWTATYWVKHLTEIRIEKQPFDGFWVRRSYRLPADAFPRGAFPSQEAADTVPITEMVVNSLVTSHRTGERVARAQRAELRGWAWDSGRGIERVEISADAGKSWTAASLEGDLGRYAWRGFHWPLPTERTGALQLIVRAASRGGARQPDVLTPNPSGYHNNVVQKLSLEIV
jgi:DMSO/TMAO reductase YedYZ molybdopterin-dependent catalytic subunit